MSLESIVKVNITRDTQVPSQTGFGIPALLSAEANAFLVGKIQGFDASTALEELIALGFTTASETYKWAVAILSLNPKVSELKVMKQPTSTVQADTITIDAVVNNFTYQATINGILLEFTSSGAATDVEIQGGLQPLIDALTDITAVDNGTASIDLVSDVAGQGYSIVLGQNLSSVNTAANVGPVEAIIEARDEDDDWYFLQTITTSNLQTELIAAYIETQVKLFSYQTDDADSKDLQATSDTTSLMAKLKAKAYDRTFGLWVPTAELGEYKQARWVGGQAPKDAGSTNWKFKKGTGGTPNKFTAQEKSNIEDKNGNVFITVAGRNMFEQGTMASGEFIDIMRGTDWITARIQEQVFGLLTSVEKVSYDDGGIESIGLQVEDVLDRAVDRTILVGSGEDADGNPLRPVVTVPKRSETTKADRAARFLRNIKFTGNYAGAVNKVQIDGNLAV